MSDQGGGGGIESHHRRQDSGEEPIPVETTGETDTNPDQSNFSQPPQDLPRGSISQSSGDAPRVEGVPPPLSRHPSSSSTASAARPTPDYLSARGGSPSPARPPAPVSTPQAPASRIIEPPVTRATLSELDVHKIVHNPKLRHDINFDPELHFRPNLDGEKGRRKQEKANQFWMALKEQLVLFVLDREEFLQQHGQDGDWCLPSLLKAVKEIIQTLVPARDREEINEGLNVELLMRQFNHGVADLEKLALWLSGILKRHCAPMRDEWVDGMYRELSNGNKNNDMDELVKGMRSLLSVLEAMKLDVANHQIRCLRPVLIDDTVNFEQRFFYKKMQARRLDISRAMRWYSDARAQAVTSHALDPIPHLQEFGESAVFFGALTRLLLPSTPTENFPSTFLFDEDRIIKLRADLYDSICLEICMRKFDELDRLATTMSHMNMGLSSGLLGEGSARSSRSSAEFNLSAPASRPSSFVHSDRGSVSSSPRNSGLFGQCPVDSGSRGAELYSNLLHLLRTAPAASRPAQKWQTLAPQAALEILRSVNAPLAGALHLINGFETQLVRSVTDVHCEIFHEVETFFQQSLLAKVARRVREFRNMSGVELFAAVSRAQAAADGSRSQVRSGSPRGRAQRATGLFDGSRLPRDPREDAGIEDMALRLSHLGLLHWRVWARLAYEIPQDSEADGDVPMDQ